MRGNSPFTSMPVKSREALIWATRNGARAFGLDKEIGSLTPGKKADIVMLRANDINMAPVWDPIYVDRRHRRAPAMSTPSSSTGSCARSAASSPSRPTFLRKRQAELAESGARLMRDGGYRAESTAK